MSIEVFFIAAFRLPALALAAQRIPKKLLIDQGAPTATDKRLINDTVDEIRWHAAPKPGTMSVSAFHARVGDAGGAVASTGSTAPGRVID